VAQEASKDVANQIANLIVEGKWMPGESLPGIAELAARYGVAQSTIMAALSDLERQSLVIASASGQRYVVRTRPPVQRLANHRFSSMHVASGLGGHYSDFRQQAAKIAVDVERIEVIDEPPPAIRSRIQPVTSVLTRSRRYFADGTPTQLATSYIPIDIANQLPSLWQPDTGPGGMYARFRALGFNPLCFSEELSARLPTAIERKRLQLPYGVPVIDIERVVSFNDAVLEVCVLLLSSNQYRLIYSWPAE
jgi:GntR family transcriptional regulator